MALTKSEKMDMAGARTAADIEQRYNFGKSFAEVRGVATDARTAADEARAKAEEAAKVASDAADAANINHEEVFNLLTNNGEIQGIREAEIEVEENGELKRKKYFYVNAECIEAVSNLFAKNIEMSGTFICERKTFVYPGEKEHETLATHLNGGTQSSGDPLISKELQPYYDFDSDGDLDADDLSICRQAIDGTYDLSKWVEKMEEAHKNKEILMSVKTPVTMKIDLASPEKAITFSGTNIWGNVIDKYIGVNFSSIESTKSAAMADYVVSRSEMNFGDPTNNEGFGFWILEKWKSGIAKAYGNVAISNFKMTVARNVYIDGKAVPIFYEGNATIDLPFIDSISPIATLCNVSDSMGCEWVGECSCTENQVWCKVFSFFDSYVDGGTVHLNVEVIGRLLDYIVTEEGEADEG